MAILFSHEKWAGKIPAKKSRDSVYVRLKACKEEFTTLPTPLFFTDGLVSCLTTFIWLKLVYLFYINVDINLYV